jgi:hypothetical protein
LSEEWLEARKRYQVYRNGSRGQLRANPKCPVCGRYVYQEVSIPKTGRPRKYDPPSAMNGRHNCKQADYRRRRDQVLKVKLDGEMQRMVEEDQILLDAVRGHLRELEDGGYSYEASIIENACAALEDGRLEMIRRLNAPA